MNKDRKKHILINKYLVDTKIKKCKDIMDRRIRMVDILKGLNTAQNYVQDMEEDIIRLQLAIIDIKNGE